MFKNIFLFMFVIVSTVFSQRDFRGREGRRPEFDLRKPIFIEQNIVPSDSDYICYFSYKIPFNNILFLKDGDNFSGGISLTMEVHKDEVYLKSETVNKKISVSDYNLTNSETDYLEGLLSLNLSEGKYLIKPTLKIDNLNRDLFIKPIPLKIDSVKNGKYLNPVVVYTEKINVNNSSFFRLYNSEGIVPYSITNYNIVIPISDSSINKITAIVKQDDSVIVNKDLSLEESIGIEIASIENAVILFNNKDKPITNLFVLSGFSTKLNEGPAVLIVKASGEERKFDLTVGWPNKPKTLLVPEFAIKILEHVTPSPEVSDLTDGDEEDYYKNLVNYWKKFDQNKETAFNEVMNEFYRRADHAVKEFSTPSNRDGTNTDRGRIYVKYGKPDEVKRSYTEKDNTIEIWVYENINKKFIFADKNGLGNFTLLK